MDIVRSPHRYLELIKQFRIGLRLYAHIPRVRRSDPPLRLNLPIEAGFFTFVLLLWLYIVKDPGRRRWLDWFHYYAEGRFIYNVKFAIFNPWFVARRSISTLQNVAVLAAKKIWRRKSDFSDSGSSYLKSPIKVEKLAILESLRKNLPFEYHPLEESKSDIRLAYVYAGANDDTIRLSLIHVPLSSAPKYEALSYRWGNLEETSSILVDGFGFKVTSSLASALSNLRKVKGSSRRQLLWIDSLSINQGDISERNQQVQLMTKIYEKAAKVLVWLGTPTEEIELAMATIKAIEASSMLLFREADNKSSEFHMGSEKFTESTKSNTLLRNLKYRFGMLVVGPPSSKRPLAYLEEWVAVLNLLVNPYWTRVWVLQEITCPVKQEVEVILGRQSQTLALRRSLMPLLYFISFGVPWGDDFAAGPGEESIAKLVHLVSTEGRHLQTVTNLALSRIRRLPIYSLHHFRPDRTSAKMAALERDLWRHELLPTLEIMRLQACTDPRDKLYAAFAITLDPSDAAFRPDYASSVREVYSKFVIDFISRTGSVDIFGSCTKFSPDLPSWCPDWRMGPSADPLADLLDSRGSPIYKCSGKSKATYSSDIAAGYLTITGICLDSIEICSIEAYDLQSDGQSSWETILGDPDHEYTPTGETVRQAYLRTIVADHQEERGILDSTGSNRSYPWTHFPRDKIPGWWCSNDEGKLQLELSDIVWTNFTPERRQLVCKRGLKVVGYDQFEEPGVEREETGFENALRSFLPASSHTDTSSLRRITNGRRLCLTSTGNMGMVPERARPGDLICVLLGGSTPYVLRLLSYGLTGDQSSKASAGSVAQKYELLGQCYIHGLMDGEPMDMLEQGQFKLQEFILQ